MIEGSTHGPSLHPDQSVVDAAIIAVGQRISHYELPPTRAPEPMPPCSDLTMSPICWQ
jgi:hypothetical protein